MGAPAVYWKEYGCAARAGRYDAPESQVVGFRAWHSRKGLFWALVFVAE